MSKAKKRASKKPGKKNKKKDVLEGLPPLNLNAAGIDVGNAERVAQSFASQKLCGSLLFAGQARSSCVTFSEDKILRTASSPHVTNEWTFIKIRAAEFELHKLCATRS